MISNIWLVVCNSLGHYIYRASYILLINVSFPVQDSLTVEAAYSDTLSQQAQGAQISISTKDKQIDSNSTYLSLQYTIPHHLLKPVKDSVKLYIHRKRPKPDERTAQQLGRLSFWATVGAYLFAFLSLEVLMGTAGVIIGIGAILLAVAGIITGIKSLSGEHKSNRSRTTAMLGFFFSIMMLIAFTAALVIWMYV